ncbi:MAG: hypothetical protein RL092_2005, partial [Bacteroidota bacterium]
MDLKITASIIILFAMYFSAFGQGTFNRSQPISIQDLPADYDANGYLHQVFQVDAAGQFSDGFMALGNGVLKSPQANQFVRRPFITKYNVQGDLMWSLRYDQIIDSLDLFFGSFGPTYFIDNFDEKLAILLSKSNFNLNNSYTQLQLLQLNGFGQSVHTSQPIVLDAIVITDGLIQDNIDSNYIAYGNYSDSTITKLIPTDGFLLKFTEDGEILWQQRIPDVLKITGVKQLSATRYLLDAVPNPMGSSENCSDLVTPNTDFQLILMDIVEGILDSYHIGGNCEDKIASLKTSDSTGVLVGFLTNSSSGAQCHINSGNFFTQKVSWTEDSISFEPANLLAFNCLENSVCTVWKSRNNEPLLVGDTYKSSEPYSFGFIYKFTQELDSAWFRTYSYYNTGELTKHRIYNIKPTTDSGYVCVGSVKQDLSGPNPLLESPWIFKVDSYGCLEPGCQYVGVSEMVIGLQDAMRVYPNPVADLLTVGFSLPAGFSLDEDTQLVLTDMQGRTLLSENIQQRGWENFRHIINVQDLAAGTYVLHWKSDTK